MDRRVFITILLTNFILLMVIGITYKESGSKKNSVHCNNPPDFSSIVPVRSFCLEDYLNRYLTEYYLYGEPVNSESRNKIAGYLKLKETDRFKIASHNLVFYTNLFKNEARPIDGTHNLENFFLSLKINIRKQFSSGEFKVDSVLFYGMNRKMDIFFSLKRRGH